MAFSIPPPNRGGRPIPPKNGTDAHSNFTQKRIGEIFHVSEGEVANWESGYTMKMKEQQIVSGNSVFEGCVKSEEIATIMRGRGIAVTGLNLQWLEGDSCTLVWTDAEGTEQTANIEPEKVSATCTVP